MSAALLEVAQRFGTPTYVTDLDVLDLTCERFEQTFGDGWIRQYSLKANHLPPLVARLGARGWGTNVVSLGEWDASRTAGIPSSRISLEGIGKTDATLRAVIGTATSGKPLAWVSLESQDEAMALQSLAAGLDGPMDVLLRLNPAVQPDTIDGLAVGAEGSKFGMSAPELAAVVGTLDPGLLRVRGVHVHVGSQLRSTNAWVDGVVAAAHSLAAVGGDTLDVGGGFPVLPDGSGPTPADFLTDLMARSDLALPERLVVEPGRALVAAAGSIVATVLHVRRHARGQQVVLDAGMTELLRPALYGARHPITALTASGSSVDSMVEGPICESADSFGHHRLPVLRRGDIVAIGQTGAYGSVLACSYNGRPLAPEVFLDVDGGLTLVRGAIPPPS